MAVIRSPVSPGAAIVLSKACAFSTNLPMRSTKVGRQTFYAGDRTAPTLAPKGEVRLQRVPARCLDLVPAREQGPS